MTSILEGDDGRFIDKAVSLLKSGGIVAMPTETVYGLAADAANPEAVARVFEAKGRPSFNPLIAHVSSVEMARIQASFSPLAEALAEAFWPGPLTLVLQSCRDGSVCDLARAGLDTVALRHPNHPLALMLIQELGRPVVAPSANASGKLSPTRVQHVITSLGHGVDWIVDGDDFPETAQIGLESTIVSVIGKDIRLLREGAVTRDDIQEATGIDPTLGQSDPFRPSSPGQLLSHYAPDAPLRLNADTARPGETLIGFGDIEGRWNLSRSGDLREAAANLFAHLHAADDLGQPIAVAPIPTHGLGLAINDRLRRAAGAHGNGSEIE